MSCYDASSPSPGGAILPPLYLPLLNERVPKGLDSVNYPLIASSLDFPVSTKLLPYQADRIHGTQQIVVDDGVVPMTKLSRAPGAEQFRHPLSRQNPGHLGTSADSFQGAASSIAESVPSAGPSTSVPSNLAMNSGGLPHFYPQHPHGGVIVPVGGPDVVPSSSAGPGVPAVYGNSPAAFPSQLIPQTTLFPTPTLLSPGALARQQRASADTKRGKRRRPGADAKSTDGPVPTNDSLAVETTSGTAQVVPIKNTAGGGVGPPVVKVKEERRKKRLLRNRVSAQQARERKRQHVVELEERCNRMEQSNTELVERAVALAKENEELRQLVRENMRASSGGGSSGTQCHGELNARLSRPLASPPRPPDLAGFGGSTEHLGETQMVSGVMGDVMRADAHGMTYAGESYDS